MSQIMLSRYKFTPKNEDTSLYRTLYQVPKVSTIERFQSRPPEYSYRILQLSHCSRATQGGREVYLKLPGACDVRLKDQLAGHAETVTAHMAAQRTLSSGVWLIYTRQSLYKLR